MDNKTFNDLIKKGELSLILMDGGVDLTPSQMRQVKGTAKALSDERLEKMALELATSPGYQEMMLLPLMSKMVPQVFPQNITKTTEPETKPVIETPPKEDITEDKKIAADTKAELSTVSPGSNQEVKTNDSEANILAKIFLLMKRDYEQSSKKHKNDEEFRKKMTVQKDAFTEELIHVLTGKKVSVGKSSKAKTPKSSFIKTALMGVGALGSFFLAEKALASVNWKSMLPDFISGEEGDMKTGEDLLTGRTGVKFNEDTVGARKSAETYLGREMSDKEFDELIRATSAEAGPKSDKEEQARIMGTILNRARDDGETVTSVLGKKNQFQAVTGTKEKPGPSEQYTKGPSKEREKDIISAAATILPDVPKTQKRFAAADISAYGPGTNPKARDTLQGGQSGGTLFEVPMPEKRTALPANNIVFTSFQGMRKHPKTGQMQMHHGEDIRGAEGQDVVSIHKGVVSSVTPSSNLGTTVVLDHGEGITTHYLHLKNPAVKVGDIVDRAQKIAEIGPKVPGSTAPHLHFEVRDNGKPLSAKNYLSFNPVSETKLQVVNDKDSAVGSVPKNPKSSNGQNISMLNNTTNVVKPATLNYYTAAIPQNGSQLYEALLG